MAGWGRGPAGGAGAAAAAERGDLAGWRSEPMRLVQLIVPAEAAHGTARRLGGLGCVEFKDLNADKSAFQRTYANQVRPLGPIEAQGPSLAAPRPGRCGCRCDRNRG